MAFAGIRFRDLVAVAGIAGVLVAGAVLLHSARPRVAGRTPEQIRASGEWRCSATA